MILFTLKVITFPFLTLILLYLLKDITTYIIWFKKYRSQGIPFEYIPLIGMPYYFMIPFHKLFEKTEVLQKRMFGYIKNGDMMAKFRTLSEKRKDAKIVALNGRLLAPVPLLVIQDPDLFLEI